LPKNNQLIYQKLQFMPRNASSHTRKLNSKFHEEFENLKPGHTP